MFLKLSKEYERNKALLDELSTVQIVHSHRVDGIFSLGSFGNGDFDVNVVAGHSMYTVDEKTIGKMKLGDLGMIEIHLSGYEVIDY